MSDNTINIKKGLDIRVKGAAALTTVDATDITRYAVKPADYVGVSPKLMVKEGDSVKAGSVLLYDKNNEAARFTSPVSGTVEAVVRGAKRAILRVVIAADGKADGEAFEHGSPARMGREAVVRTLSLSGAWTLLRQRPFGIVARPGDTPKAIFVSAFDSAPLAPDYSYIIAGHEQEFSMGMEVLHALAETIHMGVNPALSTAAWPVGDYVKVHRFTGCHPAGLVGTQINKTDPINKGETVWTLTPADICIIGHLFLTGEYRPLRIVAMAGPVVKEPRYYRMLQGASIESLAGNVTDGHVRYISGNMLSGTSIGRDGFMSATDNLLTVLPEGDRYDFMGWLAPGVRKYSFSRTFLSGFFQRGGKCSRKFLEGRELNTGMHGGVRPLVVTGEMEKVFPLDIYPLQLIKACVIGDIDLMENLVIYEVEPEDFALCEFIDTSKTEIQSIIRQGLETCRLS